MKLEQAYEIASKFIGNKYEIAKAFKYDGKFVFVLDIPNNYSGTYVAVDFKGTPYKYAPKMTVKFIEGLKNPIIDYRRNRT